MKLWKKAEKKVADGLRGKLVAGSGSSPMGGRGDVRTGRFLIEVKSTEGNSIAVTDKVLDKIEKRAIKEGLDPALALEINKHYWIAVPFDWFARILRAQSMLDEMRTVERDKARKGKRKWPKNK